VSCRRQAARVLLFAVTLALTGIVALPANALSPQADLAAKTAQARQLEAQIQANYAKADVLDEQLVQAQTAVESANAQILAGERDVAAAERDADALHARLAGRAAALYMDAGNADPLQVNVTDVRELGASASYWQAAAAQDSHLLDQLRVAEESLAIQRRILEKQKTEAQTRRHAVDVARHDLQSTACHQQDLLTSIKGQMATLVNQVQMQQQQARQAAAMAQLAAQRQAQAQAQAAVTNGSSAVGGCCAGGDPGNVPAPSGGAAAAVAYARAQLGKPYQYAGTGPGSYDCSGLTMMAWAAGGVSMAHGSQAQYDAFPHVPLSQLQPGDLVFFGDSGPTNHHVGIVVGPGMMIDAPHTGAYVELTSYYWPDLVPMGARP